MNTKYPPMLTAKQTLFVEEYLIDLNGKQAAVRAELRTDLCRYAKGRIKLKALKLLI